MPTYRLLTLQELKELEKEFIDFLVLNGIPAHDWQRIQKEDKTTVDEMIELFSDVVFESIMRKTQFLESRGTHHLHTFQCLSDHIVLVAMEAEPSEETDFTNPDFVSSAMLTPPNGVKIFTTSKAYSKRREIELFEMLEKGCVIADDRLFKTLCLAL